MCPAVDMGVLLTVKGHLLAVLRDNGFRRFLSGFQLGELIGQLRLHSVHAGQPLTG